VSGNAFYHADRCHNTRYAGPSVTYGVMLKPGWTSGQQSTTRHRSSTRTDKRLTPLGGGRAINLVNLGYKRAFMRSRSAVVTLPAILDEHRVTSTPTPKHSL